MSFFSKLYACLCTQLFLCASLMPERYKTDTWPVCAIHSVQQRVRVQTQPPGHAGEYMTSRGAQTYMLKPGWSGWFDVPRWQGLLIHGVGGCQFWVLVSRELLATRANCLTDCRIAVVHHGLPCGVTPTSTQPWQGLVGVEESEEVQICQHVSLDDDTVTQSDCSPDKWQQVNGPRWLEDGVRPDLDDRHCAACISLPSACA